MARILILAGVTLGTLLASSAAFAAGDPARGATAFRTECGSCHTATQGGPARTGPNLFGVFGSPAGSRGTFRYSPAMQRSGLTWDEATLTRYLVAPRRVVSGGTMSYAGTGDAAEAANIAAYLATQR